MNGSFGKELQRFVSDQIVRIRVIGWDIQRGHPVHLFAVDLEGLPARGKESRG